MNFFKEFFKEKKFVFNFLSLNISSVINKGFNFIFFIFFLKILSIQDFGQYTLVWAHIFIFSPLLDLGTTTYGVLSISSTEHAKIKNLYILRILTSIAVFFLLLGSTFILNEDKNIRFFVLLVSVSIFSNMLSGTYLIISSIEQRLFSPSLISTIFNFVLISISIIVISIFRNLTYLFYVIAICYALYALINALLIKKYIPNLKIRFDYKNFLLILKASFPYIIISFLGSLYFKVDLFILKYFTNIESVGVYSAGFKFFEVFMFIGASYSFAAIPLLNTILRNSKELFYKKIVKDSAIFFIIGLLISIIVYGISPYILPLIFKNQINISVSILRIVIFTLPFLLVNFVLQNGLLVLKKTKVIIAIYLIQLILNLVLNFIFVPHYSYFASAYITIFNELFNIVITIVYLYFSTKNLKFNSNI